MDNAEQPNEPVDPLAKPDGGMSRRTVLGAAGAFGLLLGMGAVASPQAAHAAVPFPLSNPYTRWELRDDFAAHKARNSKGPGVDYGLPNGTPVAAPAAGTISYVYGTLDGGWVATITHPGGYRSQLLHLSGFQGANRSVVMGEIVAFSGGVPGHPGAGSSTGAHLHWSLISPSAHIDPLPQVNTLAGQPLPIPTNSKEDTMLIRNSARGDFFVTPGVVKRSPNPSVFNILQAGGMTIVNVVDANIDAVLLGLAGPSYTYSADLYVNPALTA